MIWLELGSLITIIDKFETFLFYEQVGDWGPCLRRPLGKTINILHPRYSIYGQFTDWFVNMLRTYPKRGQVAESDWRVISALSDKHFQTQKFGKWIRAQMMFLHSATTRGYGLKFSSAPYFLWRIGNPLYTTAQQVAAAQRLCTSTADELALFGVQMQARWNTVDKIMHDALTIHQIVHRILLYHHYDSGICENINSQTQHLTQTVRARPRAFGQVSNEQVLAQLHGVRYCRPSCLSLRLLVCPFTTCQLASPHVRIEYVDVQLISGFWCLNGSVGSA